MGESSQIGRFQTVQDHIHVSKASKNLGVQENLPRVCNENFFFSLSYLVNDVIFPRLLVKNFP